MIKPSREGKDLNILSLDFRPEVRAFFMGEQ